MPTVQPRFDRVAMLLDNGAFALAANEHARTRSKSLVEATRWLLAKYRAHRIRPILGASDTTNGAPDSGVPAVGSMTNAARLADGTPTLRLPRGAAGGLARAAKMTAEQRREIASKAAKARWQRFRTSGGMGAGPPDARLGGFARARSLSPERRQEIARLASLALWNRTKPAPPSDAA